MPEPFPHSFFPFFGPSFLFFFFFFCFSGGNALQKRKAGCLGAANYSSRSRRTLVVASMWWIEEVGKGRNDRLIRDTLFSLTTPLRNQGCRKEPWEGLIAAPVPSSLPSPVAIDSSLLLTLSIGLLSARRGMALAIDICAIRCVLVYGYIVRMRNARIVLAFKMRGRLKPELVPESLKHGMGHIWWSRRQRAAIIRR